MVRYLVNGFGAYHGGIVRVHNAICGELVGRGDLTIANAPRDQVLAPGAHIASKQGKSRWRSLLKDVFASLRCERFDVRVDSAPAFRLFTRSGQHIVVVHDLNFLRPQIHRLSWKQILYRRILHHWALRRADQIVVNSNHTLEELRAFYPPAGEKAVVLPLPVDFLAADLGPRISGDDRERTRLLAFGHARNKGIDRLLATLAIAPSYDLTIVCPHQTWEELWRDEARRLAVSDRVTVRSGLTDEELAAEYASADVFCMLSSYEGYGLPVAEALYQGRPTVVSSLPVLSETARGFAVVASDGGPVTVIDAIESALETPASHWVAAAEAMSAWTWERWVDDLLREQQ